MRMPFVCLYISYLDSFRDLSDQARGKLLLAMLQYADSGETPKLTGDARILWPMVRSQMDRDAEKYREKCEINRINGSKGGRPPKNPTVFSETEGLFQKPKKAKEKEKEKEKDNNNAISNNKEKEKETGPFFAGRAGRRGRSFLDDIVVDEAYREKFYPDPLDTADYDLEEDASYDRFGTI